MKMEYSRFWISHSADILDKLVDVYQKIQISEKDVDKYNNLNFDDILKIIGNYYVDDSKEQLHLTVYSIAYDRIASVANINNTKKGRFKYWVSKKQIKALRKAYKQIYNFRRNTSAINTHYFVKIPYNTIYILNAVYEIATKIDAAAKKLNGKKLSEYLAENYIKLYINEWMKNPELKEIERAQELYENIKDRNQNSNRIFVL